VGRGPLTRPPDTPTLRAFHWVLIKARGTPVPVLFARAIRAPLESPCW